jgi:predicted Zn-dependent protease
MIEPDPFPVSDPTGVRDLIRLIEPLMKSRLDKDPSGYLARLAKIAESPKMMLTLGELATQKLIRKKYRESTDLFRMLTMLNRHELSYWLGLGVSRILERDFNGALDPLAYVAAYEPKNPLVHLLAAECYLQLNKPDEGAKVLELAERLSTGNSKKMERIRSQIEGLKELQKKSLNGDGFSDRVMSYFSDILKK